MKTSILRTVVVAAVAALALAACSSGPAEAPAFDGSHVDAASFELATQQDGVTVIDVRTPEEFASGHIQGAVNLNVEGADFPAQIAALDPDAEYAVYCRSGNRSRVAMEYMAEQGVVHTVGLEGGIGAWKGDLD